ncbi:flagellar export protein FliJ [Dissulfurimicrobium hydrothermale]|uniref:flagellar export protein FliJ n=1 Tax=Dissulfurimicrobium hydrothermale TaxID=1750598 RepID=UPI001EDBFFB2|nr:flagellar export protein FliJ [Dissulfurimicrobium hydrothermale]UKL13754.1 flagellar export protein FliJ [Dissulfurimicrobium hydrothermale]
MAYRFRLEALLRLRQRQVEAARFELARLLKQYRDAQAAVSALSKAKEDADLKAKAGLAKGMPAGRYRLEADYIEMLTSEIDRYENMLLELEPHIQRAKEALARRHVEEKLVERFKKDDFAAYMLQERNAEQKKADDLAAVRYGRNKA